MRVFSAALCGAVFTSLRVLAKRSQTSLTEIGSTWERKDARFCISKDYEFGCDKDSSMKVKTAMYSKAKILPKTKEKCEALDEGTAEGCSKEFHEYIAEKCDGEQTCKLGKEEHRKCGFTVMRVVFDCESNPPAADDEVAQQLEQEDLGEHQDPPNLEVVKQHLPDQEETPGSTTSSTTSTVQEVEVIVKQTLPDQEEEEETTSSTTTTPQQDQEEDSQQPKVPVKVKGAKGIHANKALENEDKNTEIEMKTCYRSSRTSKLWENGIWHVWTGATERLVSGCGEYEGCFKVKFEEIYYGNEIWYEDPETPPTQDELFEGELEDTGFFNWREYMSTLWGIGIRRNDAWTWGVCLPKTKGVIFAIQTWDALKNLHNAGK